MTRKGYLPKLLSSSYLMLGALTTVLVFYFYSSLIPLNYYFERDDAIIPLGAGRNLVDFGFLGVGPSGERVEAASTPLQTAFFALYYWTFGGNYHLFLKLQIVTGTAVLGVAATLLFRQIGFSRKLSYTAVLVAALLVNQSGTFVAWHNSGMDNSLGSWLENYLEKANAINSR